MDEFFRSKAMGTPGVAGATTTMITGTLVTIFGLPGHLTALIISMLFGLMVLNDRNVPVLQRVVLYVIDSMTILSVAIGLNTAGIAASAGGIAARGIAEPAASGFFRPWF